MWVQFHFVFIIFASLILALSFPAHGWWGSYNIWVIKNERLKTSHWFSILILDSKYCTFHTIPWPLNMRKRKKSLMVSQPMLSQFTFRDNISLATSIDFNLFFMLGQDVYSHPDPNDRSEQERETVLGSGTQVKSEEALLCNDQPKADSTVPLTLSPVSPP